jgi:predicted esterase
MKRLTLALLTIAASAADGAAQGDASGSGVLLERVVARADSSQSMAIYTPARYSPDRRWPVLFLMDPRGGALNPLRKFVQGAERYGYVLVSSYNTLSDGAKEPNYRALDAMLQEAQDRFAIDERRLYLAGFSGTSRASWEFAAQLHGHVAGVIGVGAGVPDAEALPRVARLGPNPFAFFGTSGYTDYNYWEVRALDATLDSLRLPHRFAHFPGVHQWPPEEIATVAVAWMELQAMRAGLRSRDGGLIDSLFTAWRADADQLRETKPLDAARAYARLADDFRALREVAELEAAAREQSERRETRDALKLERELASRDSAYVLRVVSFLRQVRSEEVPPTVASIERALELPALLREAGKGDDARARAAKVMLERAFVYLSFYEPREYIESRAYPRAIALLHAARRIKPEAAPVCLTLARTYLQAGDQTQAMESLECVARHGTIGATVLERDTSLAGLREHPDIRRLLERLRALGRA